jgi:hypothetical protein
VPRGIFSTQKSQFGYILEGVEKEDVGKFCGHLVIFSFIWYIFRPFGVLRREKSGNAG